MSALFFHSARIILHNLTTMRMGDLLRRLLFCLTLVECAAFMPQANLAVVRHQIINSLPDGLHMIPNESVMTLVPPSLATSYSFSSMLLSQGSGSIDWSNPLEAAVGGVFLLYVTFSILAGLKYLVKDGWKPKI